MAYADTQSRRINPVSLTATIAINGGVLAALLLAAPGIERVLPGPPIEIFIPVERDPPEPLPETPKPQPEPASEAPLRTDPIIDIPPIRNTPVIEFSDIPVLTLNPAPGRAEPVAEKPASPPAPVLTPAEIDPRHMRDFQPSYPPSKIRLEEEGRVTVRVLVGTRGRVLKVEPVGNPDPDFYAATRRQALSKWRFNPATRDGVPVEEWRTMSVRFELDS